MPKININYEKKYITIKIHKYYNYDISFEKLIKREEWWFDHLCGKTWFTPKTKVLYGKVIQELKENNYGKTKNGK